MKAISQLEEIRSKFNQDQQDIEGILPWLSLAGVNIKKLLLKTGSASEPSFPQEEAKEPQEKEIIEITSDSSEELTLVVRSEYILMNNPCRSKKLLKN